MPKFRVWPPECQTRVVRYKFFVAPLYFEGLDSFTRHSLSTNYSEFKLPYISMASFNFGYKNCLERITPDSTATWPDSFAFAMGKRVDLWGLFAHFEGRMSLPLTVRFGIIFPRSCAAACGLFAPRSGFFHARAKSHCARRCDAGAGRLGGAADRRRSRHAEIRSPARTPPAT